MTRNCDMRRVIAPNIIPVSIQDQLQRYTAIVFSYKFFVKLVVDGLAVLGDADVAALKFGVVECYKNTAVWCC